MTAAACSVLPARCSTLAVALHASRSACAERRSLSSRALSLSRHASNGLGDGAACAEGVCWCVSDDHWGVCGTPECCGRSPERSPPALGLAWQWGSGRRVACGVCGAGRGQHFQVRQPPCAADTVGWSNWSQMKACHLVCVEARRSPLGPWSCASISRLACRLSLGVRRVLARGM